MRWFRTSLSILLLSVLAACATPYGTEGLTGGYSEKQLEPDPGQLLRASFVSPDLETFNAVKAGMNTAVIRMAFRPTASQ